MKCFYFDRECHVVAYVGSVFGKPDELANFCLCCITKKDSDRLNEELKVNRMNLIASLLAAYPNDENKAKEAYKMLEKYVNEW